MSSSEADRQLLADDAAPDLGAVHQAALGSGPQHFPQVGRVEVAGQPRAPDLVSLAVQFGCNAPGPQHFLGHRPRQRRSETQLAVEFEAAHAARLGVLRARHAGLRVSDWPSVS